MSKHKQGFIIDTKGRISLWVDIEKLTPNGFTFWVINGCWAGRWWESDDLLTNGGFTISGERAHSCRPMNFRYTPPSMPEFDREEYNEAVKWMQDYIDGGN